MATAIKKRKPGGGRKPSPLTEREHFRFSKVELKKLNDDARDAGRRLQDHVRFLCGFAPPQ